MPGSVEPTARTERHQGGFSLIELLIAMTVLLIGLVSLLALQQSAHRSSGFSRHATEAAVIGEDAMEELMATSFASVAAASPTTVNELGTPDGAGLFTREIQVVDNGATKTVTVLVSWLERGEQPNQFIYETQISR